jgi:hypothetical protein
LFRSYQFGVFPLHRHAGGYQVVFGYQTRCEFLLNGFQVILHLFENSLFSLQKCLLFLVVRLYFPLVELGQKVAFFYGLSLFYKDLTQEAIPAESQGLRVGRIRSPIRRPLKQDDFEPAARNGLLGDGFQFLFKRFFHSPEGFAHEVLGLGQGRHQE